MKKPAPCARRRAEMIMKVRCGLMSATEAAAELGVSRKTYYKWERKGLCGLLASVTDRSCGRSRKTCDSQRPLLEKKIVQLQQENTLLHHKMTLKDLVWALDVRSPADRTKKK